MLVSPGGERPRGRTIEPRLVVGVDPFFRVQRTGATASSNDIPTDRNIADFFTKPLEAKKFHAFRRIIMNDSPSDADELAAATDEA